ncbi:probable E3 ubiquitin-protein ligase RHB1A [Ipomoea triloba]|uniref:probable E3 ubiquitin-protein ligase RHB1A n=1 Tax=Ipomoea triloba TaxID=35885 RepID=UPI00125D1CCF|nr:probable E3 ubiquitin-protein ligase RHB1A [Ipomoea triloba]GLL34401.1 probable E3 ubiquitin-protein ligase RHB1A [Ipomoea trifida]GMD36442.1 probable E3 ubiquitin-protein ligase RHB1A [Ipomoea batatas]
MGGCCCSARKPLLHGTPVFYYCPPSSEERDSLTSNDSAASGFLVDLNLDTSSPDTFRPPPPPIPFDIVLGCPQPANAEPTEDSTISNSYDKATCLNVKVSECKAESDLPLPSPRKNELEHLKPNPLAISFVEEEDVCPTCLEEYNADNPRINTKCNHHFHLSCILEWMERSDTCPVCDQEMIYEPL